jgi:hypothetical protein
MSPLIALAVIGIIVYVIWQQATGSAVRGKRLVLLPVLVTAIGIVEIGGESHVGTTDIAFLISSALIAIAIGLAQGSITRLERRDGYLWARLPKLGLWLWGALIVGRVLIIGGADAAGAHAAAGTAAILLMIGLNRAAQALVVVPRAIAAGIPFAPERDGTVFGAGWFSQSSGREA